MIIRAEDLTVRFRRGFRRRPFAALDRLTVEVREGDFFGLLGQNGAGKTTAIHCVLGLLAPSSGRVEVLGQTPRPGAPLFADVGYLAEEPRYHEYLTVEEAVTYYARLSGRAVPAARISQMLERLGLGEHRRLPLRRCSKGMKQKVGIAQCLLHEPRLLVLDEPMRGLDPMTVHLFRDILVEMNRQGVTIVMSSHLLSEVEMVAKRIAILDRGRVIAQDELSRLVRRDANRYTVEIEGGVAVPPMLRDTSQYDGRLRGTLPAEDLHPFMEYARAASLRLISCTLEKGTLEESFVAIVRGGGTHG